MKVTRYNEVRAGDAEATRIRDLMEELTRGQQPPATMTLMARLVELRKTRDRVVKSITEGEAMLRGLCSHPAFALEHHAYPINGRRRELFELVYCNVCACVLYRQSRFI